MTIVVYNCKGKPPIISLSSIPYTSTITWKVIIFKPIFLTQTSLCNTRAVFLNPWLDSPFGSLPKSFLQPFLLQNLIGHQVLLTLYTALSNPYVMMAFVGFRELFWTPHLGIKTWELQLFPRGATLQLSLSPLQFLANHSCTEISPYHCLTMCLTCALLLYENPYHFRFPRTWRGRGSEAKTQESFSASWRCWRPRERRWKGISQDLSTPPIPNYLDFLNMLCCSQASLVT